MEKELKGQVAGMKKKDAARFIGKLVAQRAIEKGVKSVVFDRGGYVYTGRVASLADGAREAGLEF
jgi:large subunit ribosomal protein L18